MPRDTSDNTASTGDSTGDSLASIPLPYLYERELDEDGMFYYLNHATERISYCHPAKLAELQDAGFVPPRISTAPFVSALYADLPVSAPWTKQEEPNGGAVSYLNTNTGERVYHRPEALARGRRISPQIARKMGQTADGRQSLPYYEVLDADGVAAQKKARINDTSRAEILHLL